MGKYHPVFRNRLRRGFTLVELLVVIGIITVLIALLVPAFSRAREAAQRTTCLSQMYQAGIALMAYSAEFKGLIPIQLGDINDFASVTNLEANNCNNRSVLGTLLGYMSKERRVLRCPVASEYPWVGYAEGTLESDTNYMTNVVVVGKRLTRVRKSTETILLQEDRYRWHLAWLRPGGIPSTVPGRNMYTAWAFPNGPPFGQEYSNLHQKGGNLLFCDGHAEWRRSLDLRPGDFGLTGGTGATGTSNDTSELPVHGLSYFSILE